ncbi:MAG TPA: 50S ribosomal protein L30 [Fibrobacteraceae bacterium]|jgi:large subunit ribosomal protein L30|nr:50S ribosomal protein L30 [Fibrobacteraceae bacterium]HQB64644.1 50S ribosomal protein L30 [Fibrobacteraceae bacterium]
MKKVRITQMKGTIRVLPEHRANLAALGLRGIRKTKEHVLTPAIQGMINRVRHLIKVEEI